MADNIITTNITAHADFSSLRAQLAAVTAQLVKLQETTAGTNAKLANQIAVMNKSFATTLTSTGQFSQHFVSLSSDVDKFGKNLDRGRLKLNDYYNAWNGHTKKTSTLIRDLAKQQVMLEQAVVQPIGKNAQGLMQYNVMVAKGLDEVKNKMAIARQEAAIMNKVMLDGSNQLINWGKNTQWAGRQLTVGLTVPLVAFGAAAQKAFREADAELVRLTKVYGGLAATSSADLAQVRKDVTATAKEIASSYGVAYKETIALAADLAATGQQGNELIAATQQTTRLAVLGEVDRQDAMKATLAIQNAFKQNTDELAQSIDFLNAVENQTSTSLADLTEAIPKAGPVIKSLGGDVKDLALYLTAMKEGGVNAAEGANAIKSAMASLINPTKVATEQFAGFGIDLKGIVNNNAGDLTATIVELQSALDKLNPLDKSRAIEQLFGKFQFARMSALFENLGKSGSQTLQVMDLMKASASDLASISERELKMMTESASGQFKRAWASVQADLAQAGEQFLRISTKVLKVVDSIIKFFQHLPGPVKTFLNALGGITAIAGPLIMMAGVMGNFIGYVVKGIFHLRQLAKGGQGFRLLTPEIIAADAAAKGLATSFYSDTEATVVLTNAVNTLAESFANLELKANSAKVSVQPAVSTVAGGVIMAGTASGGRVVDKDNPLIGAPYTRDMSHLIPSGTPQMGTIFGTVPGAKPVNIRIGKNPQAYMDDDMPMIPGLTSIGSTSTGIVAQEAAKWHAMTAAISMQSEAEMKVLKAEVMATGTVTSSLSESYQALLPQFSEITSLAAAEVRAIVEEVKANKITVEAARSKIIQLNATVEAMLAETTAMTASSMGRTANLTVVPLTSQPVVDPVTGKSNMKEMFHKGSVKEMADRIARALGGVRTSGAGYNIATTKPKFAKGGYVPGTGNTDTYHTTAEPGSFVINKASTEANKPFINQLLGGQSYYAQDGGQVPVVLTPGEAVIPASIAQKNMSLMYDLNGGPGNTSGMGRIRGGGLFMSRAATGRKSFDAVARFFNSSNYEQSHRSRQILNDAWALHSIYGKSAKRPNGMSRKELIDIAEAMDEEAFTAAHIGGKFSQAEYDAISQEQLIVWEKKLRQQYPDIELVDRRGPSRTRKNQSYTAPDVDERRLILEEMIGDPRFDLETLSSINPGHLGFDRAHTKPRDSWDTAGRYYLRNAIITDVTPNYASRQLEIYGVGKDLIPRKFSGALDVNAKDIIDERARILGFKDIDHYFEFIQKQKQGKAVKNPERFTEFLRAFGMSDPGHFRSILAQSAFSANAGGKVPGKFAQRLFPGGKVFLGMPRSSKHVDNQRAMRTAMEKASLAVKESRFAKKPVTEYGELLEPTTGRSFPVPGIGGLYQKGDEKVFVKPVLDEKAALAEMRATEIAREVHGLHAPKQKVVVMKDPTDPTGKRKVLALESKYDPSLAATDSKFTTEQYFRQLVASALRGDKDLAKGNLSGNVLSDVGPAGVFGAASGLREYSGLMPSMKDQAMINLLGVKGSGAKKFFAESTHEIPKGMNADEYHTRMLKEIEDALPKLKQTVSRFGLNQEEKVVYDAMIKRLSDARSVNWRELHGIHSAVSPSPEKQMTPAAIAKMLAADELKRRQTGHSVSLSDMAFKTPENGFAIGGLIGAITKGKAMHRIGAGFGKDSTGGWGVTSLEIGMAEKLFASTGLTKRTQRILYDKLAAALAKEMPYGYEKNAQGHLLKALEPDIMDSVIRSAASSTLSAPEGRKVLSQIDREILRKKFANWESKKDTPLTETLKQLVFKLEGREKGGPVNAGQPYIVGEKGPELFVPRNAGGIVPNKYGIGGTIGMLATMIAPQMIASKISNPMASMIAQTISFVLPQMIMQNMAMKKMAGGDSRGIMSRMPDSWTRAIGTTAKGTDGKILSAYGVKLQTMASSGSRLSSVLAKVGLGLTRLNVAAAIVTTAFVVGKNRLDAYRESMRLNALAYGMTSEGAAKAGLKFKDFNKTLQDSVQRAKDIKEQNQLLYQSMTGSGTPLNITIEEYKKLKKTVKEQFSDQIKLINKTDADDQINLSIKLKQQFMAMGMSAEEATKKIYTMYSLSNFSLDASKYTVQSDGFNNIKTAVDAAAKALRIYNAAVKEGKDATEQANQLNTAAMAIDQVVADEQEKALKKRKKDKSKPSFVSAGETSQIKWDAELVALEKINKAAGVQKTVSKETLAELKKTNPELHKIADLNDTAVSLWQKQRLIARGFTEDLRGFSAAQTNAVYEFNIAVTKSVEQVARNTILKKQYVELDRLKGLQERYQKAMKGQSVAQQISDRDRLSALQKQIDANNKLADARIKALDAAKKESDIGREIAKKQAEYDAAIATGNTAAAQQASLDIQGLQSDQQYNAQVKAIENSTALKNAPLLKQIELIQKKQQDLGDAAALAGEKLGDVTSAIDKQEGAINTLISAMANYRTAIANHKDDLAKWKTSPEALGMIAAITSAATAAKVNLTSYPVDPQTGKPGVAAGQGLFDAIASDLETSLIKNGLIVNGDIIINGKKVDVGVTAAGTKADPSKVGGTVTGDGSRDNPYKYTNDAGKTITEKEYKSLPVGSPGGLAEYIVPIAGLSNKEFRDRQAATREFFKSNNNQGTYSAGEFTYLSNGQVRRGTQVVGTWFSSLPGSTKVKSYDTGGKVTGPGTATSDSIPAMLSNGEYVIKASAVEQYGKTFFDGLNAQKLAAGGPVHPSWEKPKSPYNSKNQPTGSPYGRYWGELERLYQQSPIGFDKNGKPIFNNAGKDPWGGVEIPGLPFSGKVGQFSDYFHQLAEQLRKSSSPGMGIDKDPMRYAGSGASMGGIGNGAYGFGPLMFHKGGPVGHKHLPAGHMSSSYEAPKSILSKTGNFLSDMVKQIARSADWLVGMQNASNIYASGGTPKFFSNENQVLANTARDSLNSGNKDLTSEVGKAMLIKTGLSSVDIGGLVLGGAAGKISGDVLGSYLLARYGMTLPSTAVSALTNTAVSRVGLAGLAPAATQKYINKPILNSIKEALPLASSKSSSGAIKSEGIQAGEDTYKVFSIGKDKTRFTFKGAEKETSGYSGKIVDSDLSALKSIDDSLFVVPTTPQGLIEAALKIKPKDSNLMDLLDNFKNKKYDGIAETELLDFMSASSYVSADGKILSTIDTEGLALVIAHLSGDKSATAILKNKKAILDDIISKDKAGATAQFPTSRFEQPLEPNQVPVIHSTSHALEYDANGNIIIHPAGYHRVGEGQLPRGAGTKETNDVAVPRSTVHTTLYGSVADHIYSQWSPANKKIISTLDQMIDANGNPYSMNPTDTWWSRSPGQALIFPKDKTAVVSPFTDEIEYAKELIKRGIIKEGESAPIVAADPTKNEILHLSKETYSSQQLQEIADMMYEQGQKLVVQDGKLMTELRNYGETQMLEMGSPNEYLDRLAIQFAKKKLAVEGGPVYVSGHSLSSSYADEHVKAIASDLKVPFLQHQGSSPQYAEMPSGFDTQIRERGGYDYSDPVTIDSLRFLALNGHYPTPKVSKEKPRSMFDDEDEDWNLPRITGATGGYVKDLVSKSLMSAKFNVPKFESGINVVPADMLAMLHKNEAVVPANMNPFNPNANNATMSGAVYNITNNINGYDGDLNQLSNMVTQKTITAIKTLDSRNAKMSGPSMTVGVQ